MTKTFKSFPPPHEDAEPVAKPAVSPNPEPQKAEDEKEKNTEKNAEPTAVKPKPVTKVPQKGEPKTP